MPLKNRPGITVVIAIFIVLMFIIQMSSIMEMTTNSVGLHKGYLTTRQAYYNARSGLETRPALPNRSGRHLMKYSRDKASQ